MFSSEKIGRIQCYRFSESSDGAIDLWRAEMETIMRAASPFRILMDVSAPQVQFTRHARQHSLALFQQHQHHPGKIAFLFSSHIAPYFARIFFATLGPFAFEVAFFSESAAAIAWLNQ
jgi:hypothetical protein